MSGILYEEEYIGLFLLVTVFLGGGAAWLAGRAIAATWRPVVARRRLHADPRGCRCASSISRCSRGRCCRRTTTWSTRVVCLIFGFLGFRMTRVAQMTTQYGWINEREGVPAVDAANRHNPGGEALIPGDFSVVWRFNRGQRQSRRHPAGSPPANSIRGDVYEENYHARSGSRRSDRLRRHRAGSDQDGRRRPAHRPERRVRRAAQERHRAGGRGHQRRRRHHGPEDHRDATATTCPIPSRASRSRTSSPATASSSWSATSIPASPCRRRKPMRRTAS